MFNAKPQAKEFDNRPPDLIDVLSRLMMRAKHKPRMFPSDPRAAASYWINHQEKACEHTEAVEKITQSDKTCWKTPYHDRLAGTLKIFLMLKGPQQVFVIEHIDAGIPWRGDSIEMYNSIIVETRKMQGNPEAYIQGAFKAMREFKFSGVAQ